MDGWKSGGKGTTTAFLGAGLALGVECLGLENLGVLAGVFGGGALPVDVPDEVDEPEHEGGAPNKEGLGFVLDAIGDLEVL